MSEIKIVTAVHSWDCYDKNIKDNPNMNNYELVTYDNSKKPIAITKRYNDYIQKNVLTDKVQDAWIIFCHQDFAFMQDPMDMLCDIDKSNLYSTLGYKKSHCGKFALKKLILGMKCPYTRAKAIKIGQTWGIFDPSKIQEQEHLKQKEAEPFKKEKSLKCGDEFFRMYGKKIKKPTLVDTLSSACIIVHTDLIKNKELLFDEGLDFFMYGEELSLNAKFNKNVKSYVLPCDCKRTTDRNPEREEVKKKALEYVKSKYSDKKFCTSYDCYPNINSRKE